MLRRQLLDTSGRGPLSSPGHCVCGGPIPTTSPPSSQRHSHPGTVPPPGWHRSQNSGEVSEPPQPQLPPPLRTGTGPFSSQQPPQTVSKPSGLEAPPGLVFALSSDLRWAPVSDFFWGVLKWLFVILPRLTHLSQPPRRVENTQPCSAGRCAWISCQQLAGSLPKLPARGRNSVE